MTPPPLIRWEYPCSAGFTLRGEHSPPSGKPVLHFLHGNGYCGRAYWPMLQALQADFDLLLSDVQGHGDSDHGGRFVGWNRTARLALEAWHQLAPRFGPAPHFAVGHSFGGVMTALMLAREPAAFRRAVLLDPVLFSPVMIGMMALSFTIVAVAHPPTLWLVGVGIVLLACALFVATRPDGPRTTG